MSSPKSVRIEPDWDLILHITQIKSDTTDELDPSIEPTEFQVKKKLLAGEENSPMLAAMFRGPWHERSASTVYLKDISIAALEIWLMAIHGRFPTIDHVSIETIWLLLCSANKYGFHVKLLCSFFEDWFLANSLDYAHHGDKEQFYRQVLYPACIFDFAKGFQIATLYLTYNSTGHITEMQPGRVTELGDRNKIRPQLHLWNSAIQQLNAARGRLRTILDDRFKALIFNFHQEETCQCQHKTEYQFIQGLIDKGIWVDSKLMKRSSISTILFRMDKFDGNPPKKDCSKCKKDWGLDVRALSTQVADYFHGMCLDCMSMSSSERDGADMSYWEHKNLKNWDKRCRCDHGEPTWYFSFMGRRDHQTQMLKKASGKNSDTEWDK